MTFTFNHPSYYKKLKPKKSDSNPTNYRDGLDEVRQAKAWAEHPDNPKFDKNPKEKND